MTKVPDAWFRSAVDTMATPPDAVAPERIADPLARHDGLQAQVTLLASEIERTAGIDLPDGRQLILKTSTRAGAQESFAFQSATLAALADAPGVVVPRVLPTRAGGLVFHDGGVQG